MEKRTYYFRTSWWIVFGFLGSLFMLGGVILLREISIQTQLILLEKLGFIIFIMVNIVFGLWAFAILLTSKIILSSQGIEYHTLGSVIKMRWQDVNLPTRHNPKSIDFSLHVSNPEIRLHSWTRYAPWDAQKGSAYNLTHYRIPIYQFGGLKPQEMIADIYHFFQNSRTVNSDSQS